MDDAEAHEDLSGNKRQEGRENNFKQTCRPWQQLQRKHRGIEPYIR